MRNIKLFNKISNIGLDIFDKDTYNIAENIENADAVLVRSAKLHDETFDKTLKCIARAGAGVNNIPLDRCAKEGIVVFNTPGANANAVKELVLLSLLISSRKIIDSINFAKTLACEGDKVESLVEKGKSNFIGPEIYGKKLGVIGLGAIGVLVCNAASALGLEVYGYDPYLSIKSALNISHRVNIVQNIKDIYENADYITLHIPQTDDTKGLINKDSIALMKDDVRILNFSRGGLVNDDDIIKALNDEKVYAYITDFPNEKLLSCEKVINIPHLGASTPESEDNCAVMAVKQTKEYLENGNIINSVNYPNLELVREAKVRLCILNENIPNMVSSITSILASENINIENMANRSKGEFAYTIIETNSDINDSLLEKINSHTGIIKVRVLK